jgi:hypothetical protein
MPVLNMPVLNMPVLNMPVLNMHDTCHTFVASNASVGGICVRVWTVGMGAAVRASVNDAHDVDVMSMLLGPTATAQLQALHSAADAHGSSLPSVRLNNST